MKCVVKIMFLNQGTAKIIQEINKIKDKIEKLEKELDK